MAQVQKTYMNKAVAQGIATKRMHATGGKFIVVQYDDGYRVVEDKRKRAAAIPNTKVYDSVRDLVQDARDYFDANREFDGNEMLMQLYTFDDMVKLAGNAKKLLGGVMDIRCKTGVKRLWIEERQNERKLKKAAKLASKVA